MSEGALVLLSAVFAAAVAWNLYVLRKFAQAAAARPHIALLTAAAVDKAGIAASSALTAVLGVNAALFAETGARLIPAPASFALLVLALLAPSATNAYNLVVLLREQRRSREEPHPRRRSTDS